MVRMSKRVRTIASSVDTAKLYSVAEALESLKGCPPVKFDQSLDVALALGVDPKKSDQNVRGTVSLPSGTGKQIRILVLTRGEKLKEAEAAGAEFVGNDDLVEKIAGGWTDFDVVVASPDMMREVGRLGKVLGPRGLMPTPRAGTVTTDMTRAIQELKQGKIEFRNDKFGVVHCAVGKISFSSDQLIANVQALVTAVVRAKPATVKGHYVKQLYLSTTMGPGLKVDISEFEL